MNEINNKLIRLRYALESLAEDEQEHVVCHVESFAAGISQSESLFITEKLDDKRIN